ncbi:hypothetical protein K438DRAFT_1957128 [Mycena galopus ATCC 62051]|nr:hypothetical protein K438DRAFT_1957128 [Mycena galopus ATCC 62051]
MGSPSPRLPNELTDHVIQDLHSEPETLANCALVCRSWVPASQRIIFEKLSIHERNCTEIIEHLTSATPSIAGYVKRLNVYLWGDLRKIINRSTANLTPLLHLLLPHISHFTHVTESPGCRFPFPQPTHCTLSEFEELADLVDLVSSFQQLAHLTADELDIAEASHEYSNEDQEPYDGSKTPPPQLKAVKYRSGNMFASGGGPFLRWLAAGPQALTALYLALDAEAGDVPAGVELIGAAGDNLRTLSVTFSDQWQFWDGFVLSTNPSLRSIEFSRVSDFGESLLDILGSVVSPVEQLTLGGIQEMEIEWPGLIDVLMSPTFASLVRVNLVTWSSEKSAEELRDDISSKYPDFFTAKGIAVFARRYVVGGDAFAQ